MANNKYDDRNQTNMNPLNIAERGVWALLMRIQALAFPFVIMFFVWEVRTLQHHQTELEKLVEWKTSFKNYPQDATDLQVRIQARTDAQLATIVGQVGSINAELGKLGVRLDNVTRSHP